MHKQIKITRTQQVNLQQLMEIRAESVLHVSRDFYPITILDRWAEAYTPSQAQTFIHLTQRGQQIVLLATHEEEVVGYAALWIPQQEITALYVLPAYKKQGVGHLLLSWIEAYALQSNLAMLKVTATRNSRTFYERHRFALDNQDDSYDPDPISFQMKKHIHQTIPDVHII